MNTRQSRISDAELDRQIREAKKRGISEPEAKSVRYQNRKVYVELASGWNFEFDPRVFREFEQASESDLEQIGLWGRYTITCPSLDIDLGIGSTIFRLIGDKILNTEIGRRNGSVTSEKKKAASRTNGKLGGRPKKIS